MNEGLHVAIVGATGAVGSEFLALFEERGFPVHSLALLASSRSIGKTVAYRGAYLPVREATADAFRGVDVAFFSAGASRSRELAPAALAAGALVVDNSSAFRMDPEVPLLVPEINPGALGGNRLAAVPNCTAIILTMALHPLRALGTVRRVVVSTYQSASGGGAGMMRLLEEQTRAALDGDPGPESPWGEPYAFNLFSHNTPVGPDGHNEEESKVMAETRKILGMPGLGLNVTCVRVPVLRAHTESVTVEFDGPAPSVEEARRALEAAPGVSLVDDREANRFPTPHRASGGDDVLVGRLREDPSNPNALCMLVAGDQLRKGAALNAVQIAELALGLTPAGSAVGPAPL